MIAAEPTPGMGSAMICRLFGSVVVMIGMGLALVGIGGGVLHRGVVEFTGGETRGDYRGGMFGMVGLIGHPRVVRWGEMRDAGRERAVV